MAAQASSKANIDNPANRSDERIALLTIQIYLQNKLYNDTTCEQALQKILQYSVNELQHLSESSPDLLLHLMQKSKQYDPTLPDFNPEASAKDLLLTVLYWKIYAPQHQHTASPAAVLAADSLPPNINNADQTTLNKLTALENYLANSEDHQTPPHKKYRLKIGGIPIVDKDGKDTNNLPVNLGEYPGKASSLPTLTLIGILGGQILQALLRRGVNLVLSIAKIEWTRGANNEVMASEAERIVSGWRSPCDDSTPSYSSNPQFEHEMPLEPKLGAWKF
ncbi:hypothetical protein FGB62_6g418 [Gracilaria domingensis]|nr:hypothetical protein FGB62_25g31 [Gracilaria domingensis]KAI0566748.1 hypothetical protein FGB62_6g418 [Gracilaria domingensis]